MTGQPQASLSELVTCLNALEERVTYRLQPDPPRQAPPSRLVLSMAALADVCHADHATLLKALADKGFGSQLRLISASLALRLGWASGLDVAAYFLSDALLHIEDMSLALEDGLVREVILHKARMEPVGHLPIEARRARLAEILHDRSEPFVNTHHAWSRLSKRALFAMLESSWAGKFVALGEQIGREGEAAEEARELLAAHPVLRANAPQLYPVEADGRRKTCQRRSLCCLYYKKSRTFCGSCPIITLEERVQRQRKFVREYGLPIG